MNVIMTKKKDEMAQTGATEVENNKCGRQAGEGRNRTKERVEKSGVEGSGAKERVDGSRIGGSADGRETEGSAEKIIGGSAERSRAEGNISEGTEAATEQETLTSLATAFCGDTATYLTNVTHLAAALGTYRYNLDAETTVFPDMHIDDGNTIVPFAKRSVRQGIASCARSLARMYRTTQELERAVARCPMDHMHRIAIYGFIGRMTHQAKGAAELSDIMRSHVEENGYISQYSLVAAIFCDDHTAYAPYADEPREAILDAGECIEEILTRTQRVREESIMLFNFMFASLTK
jgi:hypothetical protein